jgi:hypothetical protein
MKTDLEEVDNRVLNEVGKLVEKGGLPIEYILTSFPKTIC